MLILQPRFYDSIADYLVHLEMLSKHRKFTMYVEELRKARELSSQSVISSKSRALAEKRRTDRAVDMFRILDINQV